MVVLWCSRLLYKSTPKNDMFKVFILVKRLNKGNEDIIYKMQIPINWTHSSSNNKTIQSGLVAGSCRVVSSNKLTGAQSKHWNSKFDQFTHVDWWNGSVRHLLCGVCVSRWGSKPRDRRTPADEESVTADAPMFTQVPSRPRLWPTPRVSTVSGSSKRNQLGRQLRAPSMRLINLRN